MKRVLLITLSAIAVCVTAQERQAEDETNTPWAITFVGAMPAQDKPISDEVLKAVILREVCNTHEPPLNQRPPGWRRLTARDLADWYKVSPERMARVLEEIVRERLSYMEKAEGDAKIRPRSEISITLRQLKDFHDPNTLELLKECTVASKDDRIRRIAILTHIEITSGDEDTVAFLRGVIAEGRLSGLSRYEIYRFLGGDKDRSSFLAELKAKNKNDNMEKLLVFMLDMVQVEQDSDVSNKLDDVLCKNLDGYTQSIQREQVMLKFVNSTNDWTRNRFGEIKAEIDKIPAGQRTDLSQRFKLPPAPQ